MQGRKDSGSGQGVRHDKGIVGLWDLRRIMADSLDGVIVRSVPRHEWPLAQAADEAAIADLNAMPCQFPRDTAFALFHESSLP